MPGRWHVMRKSGSSPELENDLYFNDKCLTMNVKDRILILNQQNTAESADISDLLLTIITKFQLFEPCLYLSEDDEWLNVSLISLEDNDISQALSIRKSEITTFGIFNREEIELNLAPQKGSEDLYQ